ncbi:hypothetical protein [Oricola sp.]|uniref:hypothetical protein n=1 Tax=Oricola sp. TaxID=1979950 RepID=UPI0025FE8A04|nr:hypothetical protein [Oricola sp.]MCI5075725.1 hypothetical protein [Oricola sp.]
MTNTARRRLVRVSFRPETVACGPGDMRRSFADGKSALSARNACLLNLVDAKIKADPGHLPFKSRHGRPVAPMTAFG